MEPNPEKHARCKDCSEYIIRLDKQDAYACRKCNKWLEKPCKDPKCGICAKFAGTPMYADWQDKNNTFVLKKRIDSKFIL